MLSSLDIEDYEADAWGICVGGMPETRIAFDTLDFMFDLAQKNTTALNIENEDVMTIDLNRNHLTPEAAIGWQEEKGWAAPTR